MVHRISHRLVRALILAAAVLAGLPATAHADTLRIGGSSGGIGTLAALAKLYQRQQPGLEHRVVPDLSSGGGIKAVISGVVDVSISSRPLAAKEQALLVAARLGSTPFVFTTGAANPISGVTTAELADMYSGRSVAWRNGSRVRVVISPPDDSDNQLLASLSPEMAAAVAEAHKRPGMVVEPTDHNHADALERMAGSLGALPLALIRSEQRPLKALALEGTLPSRTTVVSGRYPLTKVFWLVSIAKPSDSTQRFLDFMRSDAAHKLLNELGFLTE